MARLGTTNVDRVLGQRQLYDRLFEVRRQRHPARRGVALEEFRRQHEAVHVLAAPAATGTCMNSFRYARRAPHQRVVLEELGVGRLVPVVAADQVEQHQHAAAVQQALVDVAPVLVVRRRHAVAASLQLLQAVDLRKHSKISTKKSKPRTKSE